jgi:hypothetical protein
MTKSFRSLFTASLVMYSVFALAPTATFAAELRGGDQATVGSGEVINNDLYIAGGQVTSSGTIQGDLTAAGGTILVTGPVSQDVTVAGGTITLLGTVGNAIRAAGGNITIGSSVHSDIVAAGGQIQISGGQIDRDVVIMGGSARIDSPVLGSVRFTGGQLFINTSVAGNVVVDARKVTLGSAAAISGNFTYKASEPVVMESGARVSGVVTYTPRSSAGYASKNALLAFFTAWVFAKLFMLLAGALVFGLFFRRFTVELVKSAFAEPLSEIGRGLVVLIVLPVASILLLITVVGVPLGVIGLLGFILAIVVSGLIAPILLGSLLNNWAKKNSSNEVSGKTIILGVLVYFVLVFVPFLGWALQCGFFLLALGAASKLKWKELQARR